ncbi:MAG: hypothetical protein KZQ89_19150 [Candidatus Thiodiazotropha sp. (ex Lucinoma kastoroae)]|nr:hypothetical protein [Candidatus Thiodiazotropha sp. (ex Rostrolucina anterorostrata)]MCU7850064.1 hypothetical protein [Candidatus Thiodiazotropha sp. (ex Lucinoma kastoroae)]MCU7860366.1 hypothetical protein [Candidatus Thiodiazotropha sp. (ex Lucinoma kastoroae)]
MKPDQLDKARNPLLPAALVAIQRAAQRARQMAFRTHTSLVITRAGRIERIEGDRVNESSAEYDVTQPPSDGDDA